MPPRLEYFDVEIGLPWGIGKIGGRWSPDKAEREAAWEMYVELITRVTVEELDPEEGILREALASLYSLFATTRGILREHGPAVATPRGNADLSRGEGDAHRVCEPPRHRGRGPAIHGGGAGRP